MNRNKNMTQSIRFSILIFVTFVLCGCKDSYVSSAIYNEQQGNYVEAISYWNKIIKCNPNDAVAYYDRGYDKKILGLFSEAKADFNKVIERDSSYVAAYLDRAFVHIRSDNYTAALRDCNTALALINCSVNRGVHTLSFSDKNPPEPQYSVYDILARRGDAYFGLDSISQVIIDYNRGQYDKAHSDWRAAIRLGRESHAAKSAKQALEELEELKNEKK